MPKNIVVFSDGTGQDGGARIEARLSNVYKLYRASRIGPDTSIDPVDQIAFYDPGLGTDSDSHGLGRIGKTLYKWAASIAGRGIATNIADCYEFIINHWHPGDRIFLFGFSRGAYTARCIAQVLSLCGVPTHASNDPTAPFKRFGRQARKVAERAVHQVYEHGAGYPRDKYKPERDELARRFRVEFGGDTDGEPNACPFFIGVFDTVAALGASGWKRYGLIAGLTIAAAVPIVNGCRIPVSEALRDFGISTRGAGKAGSATRTIPGLSRPTLLSLRNAFRQRGRMVMTLITLATVSGQWAVTTIRGDLLPAALNIWGLSFCALTPNEEKKPGRFGVILPAIFFTLAFSGKLTTVFGAVAVFASLLFAKRTKDALRFAGCMIVGPALKSSSRMRSAKVPPIRNAVRTAIKYMIPIRL